MKLQVFMNVSAEGTCACFALEVVNFASSQRQGLHHLSWNLWSSQRLINLGQVWWSLIIVTTHSGCQDALQTAQASDLFPGRICRRCSCRQLNILPSRFRLQIGQYMFWHRGAGFSVDCILGHLWCAMWFAPLSVCQWVHFPFWTVAGSSSPTSRRVFRKVNLSYHSLHRHPAFLYGS